MKTVSVTVNWGPPGDTIVALQRVGVHTGTRRRVPRTNGQATGRSEESESGLMSTSVLIAGGADRSLTNSYTYLNCAFVRNPVHSVLSYHRDECPISNCPRGGTKPWTS